MMKDEQFGYTVIGELVKTHIDVVVTPNQKDGKLLGELMNTALISDEITYTGEQLRSGWIQQRCALTPDAIVSFLGPCKVLPEHMVDLEDLRSGQRIESRLMLHFIVEHQHSDLERVVWQQRLLVALVGEQINRHLGRTAVERHGDDLYFAERKLSVSIATCSPRSALIHLGLNVIAKGAPVSAADLRELRIEPREFAQAVMAAYAEEVAGVAHAQTKVRKVP